MSLFHFDSAASAQEAERVLHDAGLRQDEERPVFGARLQGESEPRLLFANRAMLALFEAPDLASLGRRLFAAGDPGSKRLLKLAAPSKGPRLERLRFYAHGRIFSYTFQCLWPMGDAEAPLLLGSVLDAPSLANRPELEAVPAGPQVENPEAPCETPPLEMAEPAAVADVSASALPAGISPDAKPVRFLWRSDAQDRFVEITPPLAEIVGAGPAALVGKSLAEVREGLGLDLDGRLSAAFAKRDTWSGVEVFWPVAQTKHLVPVVLGALPSFDVQRSFEGFHGFGVIYSHRAVETAETAWTGWPDPGAESAGQDKEILQATGEDPAALQSGSESVEQESQASLTGNKSRAEDASLAKNVIMLRPIVERLKQAAEKEKAELEAPPASDLSSEERDAFQEIARALSDEAEEPASDEASIFDAPDLDEKPQASAEEPKDEPVLDVNEPLAFTDAPTQDASESKVSHESTETAHVAISRALPADPLARNAAALFGMMQAGILVFRNEDPVFANPVLLKTLGYADLEATRQSGILVSLMSQASAEKPKLIEFAARDGSLKQLVAHEQCVDWDGYPATVLVLQPHVEPLDYKSGDYERESHELNAILDTATDGVAVIDSKGRILTLNRSGEALFGYDQNDVVGQSFSVLFNGDSKVVAEDYLEGLKSHGVKSLLNDGREVVGRAHQGGLIPIFMTLGRVSGSDVEEKDLKFCALLRDMTHWKKVEQELDQARKEAERASALKSDFLAKVSHEIRTPLNAILGFAEVIMDERFGPIGNERYKDYLKDIHMSGAHVMSLVNDLLDLSKIEAGKLELNFQEIDANRVISECVAIMQPQANRERVIMRMSLSPQLPHISADERSLRQIILNLLSNAVKFNEPGGQVIIATVALGSGHAIVRIKDTGIGMSEDDIGLALEPFHQLATTRQTIGTGLGLPLTKALVEANHAFFSIKSRKQEGTLVEVTFPVVQVSA